MSEYVMYWVCHVSGITVCHISWITVCPESCMLCMSWHYVILHVWILMSPSCAYPMNLMYGLYVLVSCLCPVCPGWMFYDSVYVMCALFMHSACPTISIKILSLYVQCMSCVYSIYVLCVLCCLCHVCSVYVFHGF